MKGLSNTISVIILIFIILTVMIPIMFYIQNISQSSSVSQFIVNNYEYLHNLQISQVKTGHPSIFYNGSTIYLIYANGTFEPLSNLTIIGILYLNQNGVWVNITSIKYPLVVSEGQTINLPGYVNDRPIIIITSLGNIFFLQPGSSIGPFSTGGKGGLEILAQISNSTISPISVSTNVTTNIYGKFENFTTPAAFPNQTGSFQAKVPQYVFYENSKGQVISGVFHNWIILGKASVNSTNTVGIQVSLEGSPVVMVANYTPITAKVNLQITILGNSDNQINCPINVNINGKSYTINKGSAIIQIPAGFFNITVNTLQFNNTLQKYNGVIYHYVYDNITYNGKSYISTSVILFVPPNPSATPIVYIYYLNNFNYYRIYIYDYNPPGSVSLILNGTVYQYNNIYWIIGGKYSFDPTGIIFIYIYYGQSCQAQEVYINNTVYYYPNIPQYIIINGQTTIKVYYGDVGTACPL
ncbi:hypothetical protein MetMK1DRAFT_00021350 [Metallosphaera yellowstonensis MK1]|uniref:Uncharacterized protein n=1 Tax=Metallosphaera yellowstonensis MK1 TaxID=671065 RepID=H2C6F7_9CREN|nr:hypothetical protein [Metallosphaera yellowstonensis]EHP69384.1 hypothetical protein MetMK1DRAFT_00021350 [Metallosphaera yellowstonensis MK1]